MARAGSGTATTASNPSSAASGSDVASRSASPRSEDHLHAQLPGGKGPDHGFPVRGQVQPEPHSGLGVEFVLQQVAGLCHPVVQHPAGELHPLRVGAVPGQAGRGGVARAQGRHQINGRDVHGFILPRLRIRTVISGTSVCNVVCLNRPAARQNCRNCTRTPGEDTKVAVNSGGRRAARENNSRAWRAR